MKCPYQTRVIHKEKIIGERHAEDVTEFAECFESECPFYAKSRPIHHRCRRVETEVDE